MSDILADLRDDLNRARGDLPAIAYAAGVSYTSLIRILTGRAQNPRYQTIQALRRALDERQSAGAHA